MTKVAAEAGVSKTTASLILSERSPEQFAEATRRRVLDVARRMRYQPQASRQRRQATARKQRYTVAMLVSEKLGPSADTPGYYGSILDGVQAAALAHHCHVSIGTDLSDQTRCKHYLHQLAAAGVHGLLVDHPLDASVLVDAELRDVPMVCVGDAHLSEHADHDWVYGDNYKGSRLVAEHLIQFGHERLAFLGLPRLKTFFQQRLTGYIDAMVAAGITPDPAMHCTGESPDEAISKLADLLQSSHPPTALFAASTEMVHRAWALLRERGLSVPDDISLAGYDDPPWFQQIHPALTTVDVPFEQIGQAALHRLLGRVSIPDQPAGSLLLEPTLIVRDSTAMAPAASAQASA
ncbi:MAG: LacI family DNA-binding transcriptional regulator [Phycisphaeraceae bacterium]